MRRDGLPMCHFMSPPAPSIFHTTSLFFSSLCYLVNYRPVQRPAQWDPEPSAGRWCFQFFLSFMLVSTTWPTSVHARTAMRRCASGRLACLSDEHPGVVSSCSCSCFLQPAWSAAPIAHSFLLSLKLVPVSMSLIAPSVFLIIARGPLSYAA